MITLKDINKYYGKLHVLHSVNLEISKGEIIAIVGPSGAGKTTLLQIAGTLDRPDNGIITFNGHNVLDWKDKKLSHFRNQHIGFIFQSHRLLPEFTALDNAAMPAMIGGISLKKSRERAMHLLERLGVEGRAHHKPSQMSGGECQRVAIARALVNSPDVIFADEPTGSLDSTNRESIKHIITELREELGQTFVIVTHDPSLADIADRIIKMRDGRIEE